MKLINFIEEIDAYSNGDSVRYTGPNSVPLMKIDLEVILEDLRTSYDGIHHSVNYLPKGLNRLLSHLESPSAITNMEGI